ncbi:MAG: carbohydrate kinase family protein [Anaerolineales bacterium]|nr:carbohydrate kinase family protein [Anaerolineales bacterium]
MSEGKTTPRFVIAGRLTRDYVILPNGRTLEDVPGGNALYAAVGLAIWEPDPSPGILARVGVDYPEEWLEQFSRRGLDVCGVKRLPEALDLRNFYTYIDRNTRVAEDPMGHYARVGLTFPKSLLGYRAPGNRLDSRSQLSALSLRQGDLPEDYLMANAAHLCPLDYLTHTLFPAVMRQAGYTTITLDASAGTMSPTFWDDMPALLTGLTAFLTSERELRALFQGRSTEIWQMMETLGGYGCGFVVVKRGERGQYLYDAEGRARWEISAYPARVIDRSGAGDAFCGGFLAGYRRTYDPLQAVLHGSASASLVVEGSGSFYALDALPGLAQARLEALREAVRKI